MENFVRNSKLNIEEEIKRIELQTVDPLDRIRQIIGVVHTWKDINIKAKTVNVDHQLIYKNLGDGCKFHISTPKTESGIRIIPMTQEVAKAFEEQRKINFMLAKDKSCLLYTSTVLTSGFKTRFVK